MPLFTTDAESERSGMGFTVMESFTDRVNVSSRRGQGTKITLYKIFSDRLDT
jgi:stage II sporulation protein AB (anti-sigma F factor)